MLIYRFLFSAALAVGQDRYAKDADLTVADARVSIASLAEPRSDDAKATNAELVVARLEDQSPVATPAPVRAARR